MLNRCMMSFSYRNRSSERSFLRVLKVIQFRHGFRHVSRESLLRLLADDGSEHINPNGDPDLSSDHAFVYANSCPRPASDGTVFSSCSTHHSSSAGRLSTATASL